MLTFDQFSRTLVDVNDGTILLRQAGSGPPVLLLHGFPETSLAWRKVAPALARDYTVIAADLPGYGESALAESALEDGCLSKRTMARLLAEALTAMGVERCAVVGHDRGARVAYRLALDAPARVQALAVLDVLPILDMAERLTYEAAREMGHWLWLTQPSTVPEAMIGALAERYVPAIIEQWGGADCIEREVADEYVRRLRTPSALRGMGAEYRADQRDLDHDRADRAAGRRIVCPLLAVWAEGGLAEMFGDPLAVWRAWAAGPLSGGPLRGGHFLMEDVPARLTTRLQSFLAGALPRTAGDLSRDPSAR